MIYYCTECKQFVAEEDAIKKHHSIYHSEVDTRCYEEYDMLYCNFCGEPLGDQEVDDEDYEKYMEETGEYTGKDFEEWYAFGCVEEEEDGE